MKTPDLLCASWGVTIAAALLLTACGEGEPALDPISITRDSVGIAIVENRARPNTGVAEWSLSDQPLMVIGANEEDSGHQLMEVAGAFRLEDGRIVVGDRGSGEASFFTQNAGHLRSVGGQGEGPGEFRRLMAIDLIPGDTVVVGAWPLGLRLWWNSSGEFIHNTQSGQWGPGLVGGRTLPDGTFLIDTYAGGSYGNSLELWAATGQEPTFRTSGVLLRVNVEGEAPDTIGLVVGEEWFKVGMIGERNSFAMHVLPYTYRTHMAYNSDHVFLGESHRGEVRAYTFDGRLDRIIRWDQGRAPVTAADRRQFGDEVLGSLNNPTRKPTFERWLAEVPYPEMKPAFQSLATDRSGRLWAQVSTGTEGANRWLVFERDGTLSASVPAPPTARFMDADESDVLVVTKDDLDVEKIQLFDLLKN